MVNVPPPRPASKPTRYASAQLPRRLARALIADLRSGEVPGVPPGTRLEPHDDRGAVLVLPGGRLSVSSPRFRSILMAWLDQEPCSAEHAWELKCSDIDRKLVGLTIGWLITETLLADESAAWHCESLDTTPEPSASDNGGRG